MLKFAHTADVHIRALSRHEEYRQILQAFIDDCKLQGVDHIFIGGDIFHTKTTGISPEYIDFLTWWLTSMSEVAPVHLTLGNHDGNLVNLSRQDAVSPIVEAMKNKNVHLYKKSGVYEIDKGFNLCVFSCFDEEGWSSVKPVNGCVNIAAFHGPVRGSSTETGWDVDEGTNVDFFKDFDFAFLGDIHKPQFLGFRNKKPWIAYPGTPVQQNYAEQIEHGYLLWEIESTKKWSVATRQLPNPKPFITIDWAGDLSSTVELAKSLPYGSRFRIRSQVQITQDDVHRLSEMLRTSMSATEVTFKSDFSFDKQVVKASEDTIINKTDLRSVDTLTRLLKDYHGDANLSHVEIDEMADQVKTYLSTVVASDDSNRSSKWSLRHLAWDNLFSYGEGNQINFDNLNGIVGIFGPNRTGKSSIVGSIMYSLFNTTDRGPMKNINICNVRKPHCYSKAVLDHNGTTYVVERQTTKSTNKKGVVSASTSLNLFKMRDDGELDDLCGEQRNDTEKTIRQLIGSPDDFLMTSLSAQGETSQFISQGSTKRRAILSRFLDLDIFDKMYDLASKDVNSFKSQLKNFPDRNWEELKNNSEQSALDCQKTISELTTKIAQHQTELTNLRQEMGKHSSVVVASDVLAQKKKVDSISSDLKEHEDKFLILSSEIDDHKVKIKSLEDLVSRHDIDSLRTKLNSQNKMESSILELRHLHEKESSVLSQQKKSLKILDDVPCGDDYPTCKFIKDAHSNKSKIEEQKKRTDGALQQLEEMQALLSSIKDENIADKISKHEKALGLISKLTLEVSRKETELEKHKSICSPLRLKLKEEAQKLIDMESALNNDENFELVSIRKKIENYSNDIREWDATKLSTASQHGKLIANLEALQSEKTTRDDLLKNMKIRELISSAFSKKGIPLLVTKSQLPIINAEVQKILQGIVDFTIEVESDEDSDSLEMYINYGDSRRIIELCSGMEKTIAAISLRVAMINISSLPKPNFLIIDEGFGTLDNVGVESCSRLLTSLKRYFKTIFVITHVDGIKDSADHIIEISKNEKDSKVELA